MDIYFSRVKKNCLKDFRKTNFLVEFFRHECGMDVENQIPVHVYEDVAINLLEKCETVLNDKDRAQELLPTAGGPFWDSTKYDEHYFSKVEEVRNFLKDTLIPGYKILDKDEYFEFDIWYSNGIK